jgi:hypothetical protein
VKYYLAGARQVDDLPSNLSNLRARCIVLYRPGMMPQAAVMDSVLSQSDILESRDYHGIQKNWGIRLVMLRKKGNDAVMNVTRTAARQSD